MPNRTPAEEALGKSFISGPPGDTTTFHVSQLVINAPQDGKTTLVYDLEVRRDKHPTERWELTLPWQDTSFRDVFLSPAPSPERLRQLVFLTHSLIEEWWDTKEHNRKSAKMARRLPGT
ncbi:hypothetical protein [Streptomyces sp. NPDC058657]|uniref:hypothetical protein n=1 Tax=unclassified Streptomyces TaxID=2593676 RepID=UPI00364D9F20